jgi:hypothetical protein
MSLPLDSNGNAIPVLGTASAPIPIVTSDTVVVVTELTPGTYTIVSMSAHYLTVGATASVTVASNNAHAYIAAARPWEVEILSGMNFLAALAASGAGVVFATRMKTT